MPFEVDPEKDVSYINLTLLDATEAIQTGVKEKLKEKSRNLRFPVARKILKSEKAREKIASLAGKAVKPGMITKGLSTEMPKLLMYMMHKKIGMKVAARTAFVEDSYLVVEFQVKYVDTAKLLAKVQESAESGGPPDLEDEDMEVPPEVLDAWIEEMKAEGDGPPAEPADSTTSSDSAPAAPAQTWTGWIAGHLEYATTELLPTRYKESLEQDSLPSTVQAKITDMMGGMMEKKLAAKSLEAEIAVLNSEAQARYFYSNLDAVRERKKE